MNVAYVVSEVAPFSRSGELAEVARGHCRELARNKHKVTVLSPHYATIDAQEHRVVALDLRVTVPVSDREETARFGRTVADGVEYIFVRHDAYFNRRGLYGDADGDYVDNAERFSFFAKAVVAYLKASKAKLDVLHLNDWQTALLPLYLRGQKGQPGPLGQVGTVLTVHDFAFQGVFEAADFHATNLPRECGAE